MRHPKSFACQSQKISYRRPPRQTAATVTNDLFGYDHIHGKVADDSVKPAGPSTNKNRRAPESLEHTMSTKRIVGDFDFTFGLWRRYRNGIRGEAVALTCSTGR
jgi:hypothetical protein